MANIVQRVLKGSPLTLQEHDDNFNNLNAESASTIAALAAEVTNRTNAVTAEATARTAADAAEVTARNAAIAAGDSTTLASAKSYTDLGVTTEATNRDVAIANAVTTLKGGVGADGDTLGKVRALITGTNSGTNTGDETATTIKTKLGITTLSGSNTGDQTLASLGIANVENKSSATIRGEITSSNVTTALGFTPVDNAKLGVANGVATLDANGTVPASQLPSYVDDVVEGVNLAAFPATGETGKIYVALDTNKTYRWSGSVYVYITSGAVDSVAGKTGVVSLVKSDVGLGNVDNIADADKPVSTAQAAADALVASNAASDATTKANAAQAASAPIAHVGSGGTAHAVATVGAAGFMSALDKVKLDGIASGATVAAVTSVAGKTGVVTIGAGDVVGLSSSATTDTTNAANISAGTLPAARLPALTGDITTGIGTVATTLATVTTAGTGTKLTYNAKGLVLSSAALVAADIPNLDYSKITTGKPTTVTGFGITDAVKTTDTISIAQGGTGATTASAALTALGAYPAANPSGFTANLGTVTGVTGSGVISSSGGTAPAISISTANSTTSGALTSTDWNTFNQKQNALGFTPVNVTQLGVASGVATLDATGKVPAGQLPSYVDDVVEGANLAAFPTTGETGKIYVALDTNKTYRWSGSAYVYITSGAVDSVAGKTGVVTLAKADVGLSNVDNTADASKPVSTAQAAADTVVQNNAAADATTKANAAQAASAPIAHVGSGGTAHANVVAGGNAGFMTGADKTKLDGIATGATNFTLSNASATVLGGVKVGSGLAIDAGGVLSSTATGVTNLGQGTNTTTTVVVTSSSGTSASLAAATQSLAGVLTAVDKAKLDGIATGATANLGTVTAVTGTAPIVSSGGTAPVISITAASTGAAGTMSAADKVKLDAITGTNTGDETASTIKTKLGITTLSGSNTGDQTTITGNAGTATKLQTARLVNYTSFDGSADVVTGAANLKLICRVATTANITLSGTQTIDGIAVVAGDRVLVKNQTTASANGIYVVAAGAWTRTTDADTVAKLASAEVSVDLGTVNAGLTFSASTKSTDTLGTTNVVWYQFFDSGSNIPVANLNGGTNASATTYWRGDGTWAAVSGGANTINVIAANTTAVSKNTYVFTGTLTLTLPLAPAVGDNVSFSNRSNTSTCIIARNAQPIMGLAEDMTIDSTTGLGTLVYADATRGWVLI